VKRFIEFALPSHAHVPGFGSTPDLAPLEKAKTVAPATTLAGEWRTNKAYLYGHDLMQAGFYWEAHEVWEVVWLAAPANSPERVLLQALIQTANAQLKTRMGRHNAASRLEKQVEDLKLDLVARVQKATDPFMGVDLITLNMHYNA